jgi:MFS family permease
MKNKPKVYNPPQRVALYCWIAALVGIGVLLFAVFYPIETYGVSPALIFLGFLGFLTALICAVIFSRLASKVDKMVCGEGLLAHWTYSPDFWARYTEAEHLRDRREKWGLFRLIAIIATVVGVLFLIVLRNETALKVVLVTVPGLILLCALVAWASTVSAYRYNREHVGDAYLGRNGALIGRTWHYWKLPASFIHSVEYHEAEEPYLEINYSAQSGFARGDYNVRIPVPPGHEEEAKNVAKALRE